MEVENSGHEYNIKTLSLQYVDVEARTRDPRSCRPATRLLHMPSYRRGALGSHLKKHSHEHKPHAWIYHQIKCFLAHRSPTWGIWGGQSRQELWSSEGAKKVAFLMIFRGFLRTPFRYGISKNFACGTNKTIFLTLPGTRQKWGVCTCSETLSL